MGELFLECLTFFLGASLGGSKMTKSHDSFLERALFMNWVTSSFKNDIFSGSNMLRATFSLASSSAGIDESTPEKTQEKINMSNTHTYKYKY